jgi:hypothetical protein
MFKYLNFWFKNELIIISISYYSWKSSAVKAKFDEVTIIRNLALAG